MRKEMVQFEFIKHTVGFVCLTLFPTTTMDAREWNPLFYPEQSTLITLIRKFFSTQTMRNIDRRSNGVTISQKIMKDL